MLMGKGEGAVYDRMKQALEFAALQNMKAIGDMPGLTTQERARLALHFTCVAVGGAVGYYTALFNDIQGDTWEAQVGDFLKTLQTVLIDNPAQARKAAH